MFSAVLRKPKLAAVALVLALVALASTLTYAGYLVVGVLSDMLGVGRFVAGLLLGVLFARLPWIRQGKFCTVGLLPRNARLPVMAAVIAFCLLTVLFRGEVVSVLFLGFAASFLFASRWMRRRLVKRFMSSLRGSSRPPSRPRGEDDSVIDADFRERKD